MTPRNTDTQHETDSELPDVFAGEFTDEYLTGVYYNGDYGDFERYTYDSETDEVVICDLDGDEVERIDPVDFQADMYYEIPEHIVDDPAEYLRSTVNPDALSEKLTGNNTLTFDTSIRLEYALEHVTITITNTSE